MASAAPPENSTGNQESREAVQGLGEEGRVKMEEGDRALAGNRWPREETLALLKIRSDMDSAFKETVYKAPLWDEVSRKLSELGYNRSSKKCKEKFENIYKYHRRTKAQGNGKAYRFFEQIEALDSHHSTFNIPSPVNTPTSITTPTDFTSSDVNLDAVPRSVYKPFMSHLEISTSTSSPGKESDGTHKKKRKLTKFFGQLMKEVTEKQENLQKKFMEMIEKFEQDRVAREEAWKIQVRERMKREHELLAEERSIAAAKDAAILAFLEKYSENGNTIDVSQIQPQFETEKVMERQTNGNGCESFGQSMSSRWPKEEIEALIRSRSNVLDSHRQENGSKGSLWEEISAELKKLGYDRSAKRCKEKWENMNKYFKKVKEGNKRRRSEDSKTCPYFQHLDAIHKEKSQKPEELLMHMMGIQEEQQRLPESLTGKDESENIKRSPEGHGNEEDSRHSYRILSKDPSSVAAME